jgi:hypothetical protein
VHYVVRATWCDLGRLNVVISPTARKLPWIFDEIEQLIASFERLGSFGCLRQRALCRAYNGVIWAFKRRIISKGKEITDYFRQN